MIPKHKMAILIAGLKPKSDESDKEHEYDSEGSDLKRKVDDVAEHMLSAMRDRSQDELCEALLSLIDIIREEDEEQDEKSEEDEEEEV